MVITKPVEPIAELGGSNARRISQRPPKPDGSQPKPLAQIAAREEQAKAEEKQPEPEPQTQALPQSPSLRFKVDQDSGRTVAELVDHEGQVLRQVPTEEALEIAKAVGKFQGMFVDLKV